jgi:hypothetical protein
MTDDAHGGDREASNVDVKFLRHGLDEVVTGSLKIRLGEVREVRHLLDLGHSPSAFLKKAFRATRA